MMTIEKFINVIEKISFDLALRLFAKHIEPQFRGSVWVGLSEDGYEGVIYSSIYTEDNQTYPINSVEEFKVFLEAANQNLSWFIHVEELREKRRLNKPQSRFLRQEDTKGKISWRGRRGRRIDRTRSGHSQIVHIGYKVCVIKALAEKADIIQGPQGGRRRPSGGR